MWRSWRVWCLGFVLFGAGLAMARAAVPAGKSEGTGDPARELIVLLAQGKGIPTAEEIVQTLKEEGSLPAAWGLGAPSDARFLIPEPDRRAIAGSDYESPNGLLLRYVVLSYPLPADTALVRNSLESNGDILYVGDNPAFSLALSPNDPRFPVPAVSPLPENYQWGSHSLHLPDAWDYNRGHAYVGVIDIGTAVQHPDLRTFHKVGSQWFFDKGSYRPQFAFDYGYPTEANNCPGDPNPSLTCVDEGQPQTVTGSSCPGSVCSVDIAGHGTHVAGIVGATANNANGVAGVCWGCSLLVSKVSNLTYLSSLSAWSNSGGTQSQSAAGVSGAINRGAQVLNLSFGYSNAPNCSPGFGNPFCPVMDLATDRDVLVVAAAGNDSVATPDWPARDSRVLGVAGLDTNGALWNDCVFPQQECGSNYSTGMINAPAKQVWSTFYPTISYVPPTCPGGAETGLCTGTSMASPYIAGSAALLRSVNPLLTQANIRTLLTSNLDNPPGWNPAHGIGKPNVGAAVRAALGPVNGAVLPNRLTPLFSFYSSIAEDSFYTSVPQMATVAVLDSAVYQPTGSATPGYSAFPGAACPGGGCAPRTPKASIYVFTGERAPFTGAAALLPLYRMSRTWVVGGGNPNNRDTAYVTSDADVLTLKAVGYELDGIEGYIHPPCTGSGCSGPAGSVPLHRRYNTTRLDYAVFPDSEATAMAGLGYSSNGAFGTDLLGYVYANTDADGDQVIDGFEGLAGTNPARADSDCDGASDGAEMLGFPANDPLTGGGCPVAKFKFNCTGLACTFDGSASTDNLGIATYNWAFGDGGTASGATSSASHSYAATGTYVATLTVTDGSGFTGTLSRKLNVTSVVAALAEGYFTVDPCRVLDTRTTTILTSSMSRTVQVTGLCNIPATAKAVSATITSVTPNGPGFLLVQPGNLPAFPYTDISSTLNFDPTIPVRANNAIARLATDGSGTLDARAFVAPTSGTGTVHLIVDVTGYFSEDTSASSGAQGPFGFQTVTPCRLFDTRPSSPLSAGTPRNFTVQGLCGIPSGAAAAAVNLAAISPSAGGFLTLYPSSLSTPPLVSNVNFISGASVVTANGARLPLASSTPDISAVYGSGGGATVHLVLDAQGYFTPTAPLRYHPITSCRLADTRFADLGAPALAGGEVREFQVRGNCGIPASAKAAAVNLVAVGPTGGGYLAAWAAGTTYPGTSNLNYDTVQGTVGNGAIVPLGTGANELSIVAGGTGVHVILDVFGYFD